MDKDWENFLKGNDQCKKSHRLTLSHVSQPLLGILLAPGSSCSDPAKITWPEACFPAQSLHCYSLSQPSPKGPLAFTWVAMHWGKETADSRDRSLGASSDLALLPRVLKHHCCPAVRAWLRDSRWSMTKVHLTVGPAGGSPKPSCGYFLIYRMHDWNRHTQQLAEFPRGRDSGQQSRYIWLQGLCSLYYDKCHEGKRSNY